MPAPSVTVAKLDPAKTAPKRVDPTPTGNVRGAGTPAAPPLTGAQADASGVAPEFRWPARGRIIQGFKSGGNDGINISVPEGTSVRAAENGTVAYAGSELKGYGNLVLIRHPNGFVTAYANNGELDVKRGDVVKRGQVIAKSGQVRQRQFAATAFRTAQGLDAGRSHLLSRRPLTAEMARKSSLSAWTATSLTGLPRDTIDFVTAHR